MILVDHNGIAFEAYVVLSNLSNWCRIVNIVQIGKGIISFKKFIRNTKTNEDKLVS